MLEGFIELLYRALEAPLGIVVRTSDPERARQRFYAARKTNPAFDELSIKPSNTNPGSELWIVRKTHQQERPTANG